MFQYFHPPTIPPFHYSTIPLFPTLRLTLPVPSRGGLLPARPPLRTVLESFPSYGSSRSNRCAHCGHAAATERRMEYYRVTPRVAEANEAGRPPQRTRPTKLRRCSKYSV